MRVEKIIEIIDDVDIIDILLHYLPINLLKRILFFIQPLPYWPVGVIELMAQTVSHIKGTIISLVLMHSGIVNGYQLLFDAHTVLERHRGTAAFFYFTRYCPFQHFLCMYLSL